MQWVQVAEQKRNIDWQARLSLLLDDVVPYRNNRGYDCIIGVSGGKDSYYQVHFVKEVLKLNPLLVTTTATTIWMMVGGI